MKLAARIFTALAIAFAISYVAARDHAPDVSAAAATIDVLNVGTCYATSIDPDVFEENACRDGGEDDGRRDAEYDLDSGSHPGVQGIELASEVWATYAVDPKTSADEPRAILANSDLLKISILDAGRDKRTPVLLRAGEGTLGQLLDPAQDGDGNDVPLKCYDDNGNLEENPRRDRSPGVLTDGLDREICAVYEMINTEFFPNAAAKMDGNSLLDVTVDQKFVIRDMSNVDHSVSFTDSRPTGNVVEVDLNGDANYMPLHHDFVGTELSDDTVIKFYGYLESSVPQPASGCTTNVRADQIDQIGDDLVSAPMICDLTPFVNFDEDVGSGNTPDEVVGDNGVSPWITFGVTVPTGDKIHVRYVYYETSEREVLIGNDNVASDPVTTADRAARYAGNEAAMPAFSDDDPAYGIDLKVEADGDRDIQHLFLRETGRFDGRYVGYVRLTDTNGNTVRGNPNPTTPLNWGRPLRHATGSDIDGAAVLGVGSASVEIKYQDFDGDDQQVDVQIDTQPPDIAIEAPEYGANFDEQRIRVVGTFDDGESRLREDGFRLFLDNDDDMEENGEDGTPVFRLTVDSDPTDADGGRYGCVAPVGGSGSVVQVNDDYVGYALSEQSEGGENVPCARQFGIIEAKYIFLPLTNEDGTETERAEVDPDDFDDGALEGTFDDIARLDIEAGGRDLNNTVDFQAFVLDRAGNIGFSDGDADGPTFINDLGTKLADRETSRYNVLGWYARHIVSIDQLDPRLGIAVTGFYGENDDDEPQANARGLMLLFDGAINPTSVDVRTFDVELDALAGADPEDALVVDVDVVGDAVYLLLSEPLAADATPKVSVSSSGAVEDPAGNQLTNNDDLDGGVGEESRELEAEDGIPPTLRVSLLGGSGTGTGKEGPSSLTKESITIRVTANEELQRNPSLNVVCKEFAWTDEKGTMETTDDEIWRLKEMLAARSGKSGEQNAGNIRPVGGQTGDCDDDADMELERRPTAQRPGLTWEFEWKNSDSDADTHLPDGTVTVIAFARDKNGWSDSVNTDAGFLQGLVDNSFNWGAATAEFTLDNELLDPTMGDTDENIETYGFVQPRADSAVFNARPFVMVTFEDASTVFIDSMQIGGTAVEVQSLDANRFLYWPPEALSLKKHEVEVESRDAADNTLDFSFEFEVKRRTHFEIELLAGWNAVSVPAMPEDPSLESVFTIDDVDQVVSWDVTTPDSPWRIATKTDGVWSTNEDFAPLRTVESGRGYWVHSNGFTDQPVLLAGIPDRESAASTPAGPIGISTVNGWNFVGIVDTDGDQTQSDHFGQVLRDSQQDEVSAESYLRGYTQAYTWDPVKSQFNVVEAGDSVSIGDGVWVYYAADFDVAP